MVRNLAVTVAVLVLWTGVAQAEPVVSFSKTKTTVTSGETFSVDIIMSDFPVSQGGGVSLRYRPAVLQVRGVTVNDATWSYINNPGTIINKRGKVKDILFSAFPGASGDGVIATVEFEAMKRGKSRLKLMESEKNKFASGGEPFSVVFRKALVRVNKPQMRKSLR